MSENRTSLLSKAKSAEQVTAFRYSGRGAFKVMAHLFGVLKLLSYFSYLVVGYFAFTGVISWWWLAACYGATMLFEHLSKSCVHAHLMKEGYDYYGVAGEKDGTAEAREVVGQFGAVIERLDYLTKFYDVKELPFEKEEILGALIACYQAENDDEQKEVLKVGLMALTHFQNDIGVEPFETVFDPAAIDSDRVGDLNAAAKAEYAKYCLELES